MRGFAIEVNAINVDGKIAVQVQYSTNKPNGLPSLEGAMENALIRRVDKKVREYVQKLSMGGLDAEDETEA